MGILQRWAAGFTRAPEASLGDAESEPGTPPDEKALASSIDALDNDSLKRTLQGRHIQFIALGGSIGTGLFIGSGETLVNGGPGSLVLGFLTISVLIVTVVFALGELASVLPLTGAFSTYATRFLDPSWGFAMGYVYWIGWNVPLPLESIATAIIIKYWDPSEIVPRGVWVAIVILVIVLINLFGVRGYGEFEFAASFIKVLGCIGFIICAVVINCGGAPAGQYLGAATWHHPHAFENGFKGFCSVFTTAAFAFAGTELVGLAAAETRNPSVQLPKACKQVVFRVLLFYILSLFMISLIVPFDDSRLSGGQFDTRTSPFVLAIKIGGIKVLPDIFNAVILISCMSVANAGVYASSRTLLALAQQGQAPKLFRYIDRNGRPLPAVILSLLIGLLGFLIYSTSEIEIFVRRGTHPELAREHRRLQLRVCLALDLRCTHPIPHRVDEAGALAPGAAVGVAAGHRGVVCRGSVQPVGDYRDILRVRLPHPLRRDDTARTCPQLLPRDGVGGVGHSAVPRPQARHPQPHRAHGRHRRQYRPPRAPAARSARTGTGPGTPSPVVGKAARFSLLARYTVMLS